MNFPIGYKKNINLCQVLFYLEFRQSIANVNNVPVESWDIFWEGLNFVIFSKVSYEYFTLIVKTSWIILDFCYIGTKSKECMDRKQISSVKMCVTFRLRWRIQCTVVEIRAGKRWIQFKWFIESSFRHCEKERVLRILLGSTCPIQWFGIVGKGLKPLRVNNL